MALSPHCAILLAAKRSSDLSFADLGQRLGQDEVWVAGLLYGQATASPEQASALLEALAIAGSEREALLEAMPPFLGGGEMIQDVYLDHSSWAELPHKFEAGTPAIGEAIGMGAALDYLSAIGLERIHAWEQLLTRQLFARLQAIEGVRILGPTPDQQPDRGALAAFTVDGLHANDISALLDSAGICIRSGHHCTQPLHRLYGLPGSARASLGFTTTPEEIDRFAEELEGTITFLREHS